MKNKRRIIALCLAIVLMMSMAITASAATETWTDSNGNSFVATVNEGNIYTNRYAIMSGTTTYHSGAAGTKVYLYSSSWGSIAASTSEFPAVYRTRLCIALNNTPNLSSSRSFSGQYLPFELGDTDAPGNYAVYAKVTCKNAPWYVDKNSFEIVDSGTLSYAPTSNRTFVVKAT